MLLGEARLLAVLLGGEEVLEALEVRGLLARAELAIDEKLDVHDNLLAVLARVLGDGGVGGDEGRVGRLARLLLLAQLPLLAELLEELRTEAEELRVFLLVTWVIF